MMGIQLHTLKAFFQFLRVYNKKWGYKAENIIIKKRDSMVKCSALWYSQP